MALNKGYSQLLLANLAFNYTKNFASLSGWPCPLEDVMNWEGLLMEDSPQLEMELEFIWSLKILIYDGESRLSM